MMRKKGGWLLLKRKHMNSKVKSVLLWILAFVITVAAGYYQRVTGPTYEIRGGTTLAGETIRFKLIRTYEQPDEARITVMVPDTAISGEIRYRRFRSFDNWTTEAMQRHGDTLTGLLPHQEAAGKVMSQVTLRKGDQSVLLTPDPAILRYKGYVPLYVLLPHILIIFCAMLFSTRAGFEALFGGNHTYAYTWVTLITLVVGGMILGPIIQKFAFGVYWTGWPFGHDLTDNKSLVGLIFWIIALLSLRKNRTRKAWVIVASVVLFVVFMIPHSMLGSEIDYTKEAPKTTNTR
jgi:hypothetical protein